MMVPERIKKVFLLTAVTLLVMIPQESETFDCSLGAYYTRVSKCRRLSLTDVVDAESKISLLCDSVECSLACYENAVGECIGEGLFQVTDFKANRVFTRYFCANKQEFMVGLTTCATNLKTWSCLRSSNRDITEATRSLQSPQPNYDTFRSTFCSAITEYRKCSITTPITSDWSCSRKQALLIQTVLDTGFSLKPCGIEQTSSLFTKFSGATQCHNTSSSGINSNVSKSPASVDGHSRDTKPPLPAAESNFMMLGVVIGALVLVVAVIVGTIIFCYKRSKTQRENRQNRNYPEIEIQHEQHVGDEEYHYLYTEPEEDELDIYCIYREIPADCIPDENGSQYEQLPGTNLNELTNQTASQDSHTDKVNQEPHTDEIKNLDESLDTSGYLTPQTCILNADSKSAHADDTAYITPVYSDSEMVSQTFEHTLDVSTNQANETLANRKSGYISDNSDTTDYLVPVERRLADIDKYITPVEPLLAPGESDSVAKQDSRNSAGLRISASLPSVRMSDEIISNNSNDNSSLKPT